MKHNNNMRLLVPKWREKEVKALWNGVCSYAAPTQIWALILPTGGISSSADSDSKGFRLEPQHYCLIVLSRKYGPLCFMQGGGGGGRPSCHSKSHPAKQTDRPASCGALVRTSAASSIHSCVHIRATDVPASSKIQDLICRSPTLFILISCCSAPCSDLAVGKNNQAPMRHKDNKVT